MPKEKATADRVMSGVHFMLGNYALVEGAISAGCNFFAGYPITPANEISERMSQRLPEVGGIFVQGEDELCSIYALALSLIHIWSNFNAGSFGKADGASPMLSVRRTTIAFSCRSGRMV